MKRLVTVVLGLLLVAVMPAASLAQGNVDRETELAHVMRGVLKRSKEPAYVATELAKHGGRFQGYRQNKVTFVHTGEEVVVAETVATEIGPDMKRSVTRTASAEDEVRITAGEKADLTLTMWLYEWRESDGSYKEMAYVNGEWSDTEYTWLDDPLDVIDVRWIVGDLTYSRALPYDGVQNDQHTQGIASFTVRDQVANWDLFVYFRPSSSAVIGKWTNVFVNYTHTWFGARLGISLASGPNGSTGTITLNTDARTWIEGTGLALRIGSEQTRGPAITGEQALPL
jgi:hypothetical protein